MEYATTREVLNAIQEFDNYEVGRDKRLVVKVKEDKAKREERMAWLNREHDFINSLNATGELEELEVDKGVPDNPLEPRYIPHHPTSPEKPTPPAGESGGPSDASLGSSAGAASLKASPPPTAADEEISTDKSSPKEHNKGEGSKRPCHVCQTPTLKKCCNVPYCSSECQRKDWSVHKKTCSRGKSAAAQEEKQRDSSPPVPKAEDELSVITSGPLKGFCVSMGDADDFEDDADLAADDSLSSTPNKEKTNECSPDSVQAASSDKSPCSAATKDVPVPEVDSTISCPYPSLLNSPLSVSFPSQEQLCDDGDNSDDDGGDALDCQPKTPPGSPPLPGQSSNTTVRTPPPSQEAAKEDIAPIIGTNSQSETSSSKSGVYYLSTREILAVFDQCPTPLSTHPISEFPPAEFVGIMTSAYSPTQFHVVLASCHVREALVKLLEYGSSVTPTYCGLADLNEGSLYGYVDDYGDFYRVELIYRSGAVVLYDMGLRLTIRTSRLFQLSEEIKSIPRFSIHMALNNLYYEPEKKEGGREFLFSLMKGRPMVVANHSVRAYKSKNIDINFILCSVASLDHSMNVFDQVLKNDFAKPKKEDGGGKSKSPSKDSVFRKKLIDSPPSREDSSPGKLFPARSPAKAQEEKEGGGSGGDVQTSGGFGSPTMKTPFMNSPLNVRKPMFIDGSPDKVGKLRNSVSTNQNGRNRSPEVRPQTPPTQRIQSPDGKSGIKYKLVQMSNKVPFHNPPVGVVFEMRPIVVLNPNIIWAQVIHGNVSNFKLMETDLNKVYGSRKNEPYAPAQGEMCAAKYPQDQKYYRVEVLCVNHSGTVDIRLVDYGHRDTVTMRQIHHLEPIFLSLPKQALQFSLVNIVPSGMANTWSDNAIAYLKERILNRVVPVKIVMQTPVSCMAEVWDPDERMQLLNSSLVELGLAQESPMSGHFGGGGILGGDTLRGVSITARQDQPPKAQPTALQDREQLSSLVTSEPDVPSHPPRDSEKPLGGSAGAPNPANSRLQFSLPILLKPVDFEKPKSATFNPLLSPPSSVRSSTTSSPEVSSSPSKVPNSEPEAQRSPVFNAKSLVGSDSPTAQGGRWSSRQPSTSKSISSSSCSLPPTKIGESVAPPKQFGRSISSPSFSGSAAAVKASGWSPKQPSTSSSGNASMSNASSTNTVKASVSGWSPMQSTTSHTVTHSTEPAAKMGGWGPKQPGSNSSSSIASTPRNDGSTATRGHGWSPKPPGIQQQSLLLERDQEPSKGSSAGKRERSPPAQTGGCSRKLTIDTVQLEANSKPVEAIVLHVENPLRFCIQVVKDESCDSYMKMASELNEVDLVRLTNPSSNCFCLCRFPSDGTIGRVKILRVDNDCVHVLHLDYGNREKVTPNVLFKMDQRFARIPAQAIQCTLNQLLNPSGKNSPWMQEAVDFFLDKVRTEKDSPDVVTVTCVQVVRGSMHIVNVTTSAQKGGRDLLGLMVEAKLGGSAAIKFDKNSNQQRNKEGDAPKGRRPSQSPFSKPSSSNLIGSPLKQSTSSSEGGLSWTKSSSSESAAAAVTQADSPFKKQAMKSPFSEGKSRISPSKDGPHKVLCKSPEMISAAVTQKDSPFKKETMNSPFSEGGNKASPTKDIPGKPSLFKSESARASDSKLVSSKRAGVLVSAMEKVLLPSEYDAVTVLITEVCSPDEFYVHTADSAGKSDELFASLCEYFSKNKLQPLSQVPAHGSLVCAKFSQDGAWYRAEVLESSADSCRVRFIDFGNTETGRLSDMTECPSQLISIPILASCCRVGGVAPPTGSTLWSDEATQLLKEVGLVQAEIVDSASSPPTLKLTTKEGVDVATELINRGLAAAPRASPAVEAKVGATRVTTYPQVASLPKATLTSDGSSFTVLVSEACSPDKFYIQSANNAEKIGELCASLLSHFTSNKVQPLAQLPHSGCLVCAKFSQDGAWYRAEVLESSADSCRVRFIDFGNTETVQLSDMTECPSQLVSVPILASCCRLGGVTPPTGSVTWSDEATQLLKEVGLVQAEIVDSVSSPPALKLTTKKGVDVATKLINRGLAAAPRAAVATSYPQVASLPKATLTSDGNSFTVLVTEVPSPAKFYIQSANYAAKIGELCASLLTHFTSNKVQPLAQSPPSGCVVCAKFSQDDAWYRAEVLESSADSCRVRFIDFGNTETVRLSDMSECPSQLVSIPILASCCGLGGVTPPTGSATWSDEATQLLKEVTSGVPVLAEVVDSASSSPALKLTTKEGEDIATELINRGLAAVPRASPTDKPKVEATRVATYPQVTSLPKMPLPSDSDSFTVLVTEVSSPAKFYVQAANSAGRIDELCTSLFTHFTSNKPQPLTQPPGVGCLFCAKFSQDGAWYRAEILDCSADSCRVRFIDFGNTETVRLSDMTECPSQFVSVPILASCCRLGGVTPPTGSATWSGDATQLLKEVSLVQAKIVDSASSPPALKLTTKKGVDIATELINRGLAAAPRASPAIAEASTVKDVHSFTYPRVSSLPKVPLQSDSENFTVLVTEFSSPDEFYIHTAEFAGKVDELCTSLFTHFTSNKPQPLTQPPGVGCLVCGKFSQDGAWYRAEILKQFSDSYLVRFIDFGNVETVRLSDMSECPSQLVSIPILASCCRLGRVTPPTGSVTWSDEATQLLKEATSGVPLLAEVVDSASSPPALKLTNSEDVDLCTVLISKGLAATSKPSDLSSAAKPTKAPSDRACPTVASLQKVSLPPENEPFFLVVTDVYSPDELYLQTLEDAGAIDELVELLNKHFSENRAISFPQTPATGSLVCAKFSQDGGWYRGEVLECSAECCRVLFVDYGNIENVKPSDIAECPPEFISSAYPRLASCCRLSGVAPPTGSTSWSKEAARLLISMASNSLSEGVLVDKSSSPPSIKLKNDTVTDFAAELVAKGLAGYCTASPSSVKLINQCPQTKETPACIPEYPKVSGMQRVELGSNLDYFPVIISDVQSPEAFFIIPINQKALMEELRSGLNSHFQSRLPSPLSQLPSQGSLVCAKYSKDGEWYRGEVLEAHSDSCRLLFIDYGNVETVKLEDIARCPVEYTSLPVLATKCSLNGATPSTVNDKTWPSEAIVLFQELTSGVLNAKVVSEGCDGVDTVPLELVDTSGSSDVNIASELVDRLLAQSASSARARAADVMFTKIPVADIPTGVPIKVRFVFITDPSDFFVHNCEKSSIAAFQEMGMTLQSTYNTSESNYRGFMPAISALCCCQSLLIPDKSWYRCKVVSLTRQEAKIQSLDFGFMEKIPVDKLFFLDPKFVSLPAQAVPCYLSGVQPTSPFGWNNASNAKFKSLLKEKMNATVEKEESPLLTNRGKRAISLFTGNGNKSVATALIESGYATVDPFQALLSEPSVQPRSAPQITSDEPKVPPIPIPHGPIPTTKLFPVILTHVESLSEFYLQVVTKERLEQLCELLRKVHEYAQTADDFKSPPPLGTVCIAMHSDNSWYRAQMVKIVDNQTCSVSFFDFGNVGDVSLSNMKPVSKEEEEILSHPVQALKCGLYGAAAIPSEKLLEVMNLFSTLVPLETVKNCRIVSKYPLLVDLECGSGCPTLSLRDELARSDCLPKPNDLGLLSLPSNKLPPDSKPILVTEVKDPSDFWLQIIDESVANQFEVLMGKIHHYATAGTVQNLVPVLGQLCIAKYSQDNVWYRARVIQVDNLGPLGDDCKVKVQFIDYGNEEVIDTDQLRPFQHQFKCLPAQAVRCSLVGFKVSAPSLAKEFCGLVENKKLFALKKDSVTGDLCTTVELIDSAGEEDVYIHLQLSHH